MQGGVLPVPAKSGWRKLLYHQGGLALFAACSGRGVPRSEMWGVWQSFGLSPIENP